MQDDVFFMQKALQLAHTAAKVAEVPVGAVLVIDKQIIAEAHNQPITACDPTAHAEMLVLRQAALILQNYRLLNSTLYVTLEPCLMCLGAITHARVARVVFGAFDQKNGALQFKDDFNLNHYPVSLGGVLANECGAVLKEFFQARR